MTAFEGRELKLALLADIELPSGTLRWCDAGYVRLSGETYRAHIPGWGSFGEAEEVEERAGDEAPGMTVAFVPESREAAAALCAPENQKAPVNFYMVRVDRETGIADPNAIETLGDLLLDEADFDFIAVTLTLGMVSAADQLMVVNKGNVLSDAFHQSVWPGELGLVNAVDTGMTRAWRVASPPRGSVGGGGAGGGGGWGGGGGGGAQLDALMPGGWRQA